MQRRRRRRALAFLFAAGDYQGSTMHRIELLTSDGRFVAVVEIIPFPMGHEPNVVIWGTRTFTKRDRDTYVEAFAMVSMTPSPGLEQSEGPHPPAPPPPPVDRSAVTTLRGATPEQVREQQATQPVGMHPDYIVLSDAERAKGFVRPVRHSYEHVGIAGPRHPLRDLTAEEHERYDQYGYVKFEAYEREGSSVTGSFWTQARLDAVGKGCGMVTTMGDKLAETYARDPNFYGSTFCCRCNKHLPVGPTGEFVWEGTDERVGT